MNCNEDDEYLNRREGRKRSSCGIILHRERLENRRGDELRGARHRQARPQAARH
jgi:hypothetical protein